MKGASTKTVTAKEVISCGGAFNRPTAATVGVGDWAAWKGAASRSCRISPASARTCRISSRSISSTPAKNRCRSTPPEVLEAAVYRTHGSSARPGVVEPFRGGCVRTIEREQAYPNLMFHFRRSPSGTTARRRRAATATRSMSGRCTRCQGRVKTSTDPRLAAVQFNYRKTEQDLREWPEAVHGPQILNQPAFDRFSGGEISPVRRWNRSGDHGLAAAAGRHCTRRAPASGA